MTDAERRAALEAIAEEIRDCTRCRLHAERRKAVPGEGSASTEVVFVGEGPGFNEDRQGRPFVGQAGSFLDELLASVGWRREDVFITNVVKCRPPGNRDPEPDEIAACASYLHRQLEVLDPALVVTLGRHSMSRFMPGARIGQAHGTARPADPATGTREALVFAMYHPAAALHQGSLRQTLLDDMQAVPAALTAARERRTAVAAATAAEPAAAAASITLALVETTDVPVREVPGPPMETPITSATPPAAPPVGEPPFVTSEAASNDAAADQMTLF